MMILKSDQAEYTILTILEAIAENDQVRKVILKEIDMDDDTFAKFVESVQISCEDVRL
jgi:hypothetical protein